MALRRRLSEVLHLLGFQFKSASGRWLTIWALAILGFPAALWLIGYLGGCVASSTGGYCNNIPDFFASGLFAFYVFQVFGGFIISAMLFVASLVMPGLGISFEISARHSAKR